MRAFEGLPLETDRLRLRPLREDDADALFAIHADVRVMRYWSSPPWTDIEKAHAMIEAGREAATGPA